MDERDFGDEQPEMTERERRDHVNREHPHNECDCRRDDDASMWCWIHRQMWEDEG
jgi:hypothetical protein